MELKKRKGRGNNSRCVMWFLFSYCLVILPYQAQINQLTSDVFCRWISDDAYLMHRCFNLDLLASQQSDRSQMLQKRKKFLHPL